MGVGWSIGVICGTAAEHLAPSQQLSMNLQADDGFIDHGGLNIAWTNQGCLFGDGQPNVAGPLPLLVLYNLNVMATYPAQA
jgi:hypothetical protein